MAAEDSTSLFSTFTSFFLPTAHAEEPSPEAAEEVPAEEPEAEAEEEAAEEPAEEEEDEDEDPEDQAPAVREDCEANECKDAAKHFKHCADKIEAGKGWHGEDCVEELFHVMHCVDACAAPKLFKKLA
ncbi:Cytochrome b-c1 complex subunit 6, mitochondrial [Vanrija albida]|uniref:Cytochrome b-c1 complex subunit 6, mitochondrial n=1 Tax=Vanrija albida TaxID=181172 RepID=A0ABR3PUK1_9TREE